MSTTTVVTGDKYLDSLVKFVANHAGSLIDGTLPLRLNPVGLHYVHSRLDSLREVESLLSGAPVDYLRAYVSDLGDHRALEQLRRILRLLTSLKVVSVLSSPSRDPTPVSLLPFGRLKVLELRGCDLSTSAARGLLELRHTLEKLVCHNSTDALRHVFASRIAEIKDSPMWNRLSLVSCARNGLLIMDESLQLLPAVETLDLSRNKFAKVDNLRKCTKLKHLDLGFNHLRTITSFSEVSGQLVKLVLRNNALTTLRGIENLKCLEGLDLSYNVISNFSELEILARFPSLLSLWMEGNPLCCARWYRAQVFSIFLYPDKLKLDGNNISTREFWKVQIIIASRQKQPSSFGFYSPAKVDSILEETMNTKRIMKKHCRLASIESEELATRTNSDEDSVACENETHSKMEDIVSDEEREIVELVERIEKMKKERSDLWLQEFRKWLIQDSENCFSIDDFNTPAVIADKNQLKQEPRSSYLGESSRYISDNVQVSGDESSTNILEIDSSFADCSFVFDAHHNYGGTSETTRNISTGNTYGNVVPVVGSIDDKQEQVTFHTDEGYLLGRAGDNHPDLISVPRGGRRRREPPHFKDDILHRRHNLVEEYLQLSADSFSVASSDSNTSCAEDDFTEYGPSIPDSDLALIEELSERSSFSTLRNSEDIQYQKCNGFSQVAQNGLSTSGHNAEPSSGVRCREVNNLPSAEFDGEFVHSMKQINDWLGKKSGNRKQKRRLIALVEDVTDIVDKSESVTSLNGNQDVYMDSTEDKQQRPMHHGRRTCDMGISLSNNDGVGCLSNNDGVRTFLRSKSSSGETENFVEHYFNTDFAEKGVGEICRKCVTTNCMIEHTTGSKEGEVAILLSSDCKLYFMLIDANYDGSEINISLLGCHGIEDVRQVLVGLGLQLLRIYFENGQTYLFITRSIDKSRQLLRLLHSLDSDMKYPTESVEQVQVELFQRDICGCLKLSVFQYAMVLFWCNNMKEDMWLPTSLFVLEGHLLVCTEDVVKFGSLSLSPYFGLHSCCFISDVSEVAIDSSEGWSITLTLEAATREYCALMKMEQKTASCPLKWKLEWLTEDGIFNFVALLKAIHAGVSESTPLRIKCIS